MIGCNDRRLVRLAVIGALALALAACGRKGPLDPPPSAGIAEPPPAAAREAAPPPVPQRKSFFLDFLLK